MAPSDTRTPLGALFKAIPTAEMHIAEIERHTLPPSWTYAERVRIFPADRGRQTTMTVHLDDVDVPILLKPGSVQEEALEAIRVVARKPRPFAH